MPGTVDNGNGRWRPGLNLSGQAGLDRLHETLGSDGWTDDEIFEYARAAHTQGLLQQNTNALWAAVYNPELPQDGSRPGVCAYTATRWGSLIDPRKVPAGESVPRAGDCYRFNLSHPGVDMTLCGPSNREHVREACEALAKGPLDEGELAWMRRVGDHVRRSRAFPLGG